MTPLYLIATIRPREDRRDDARAALSALMAATRLEAGCELYDLVTTADESAVWLMLEKWTSRSHWDSHMTSAHNFAFGKIIGELVSEPITLELYNPA